MARKPRVQDLEYKCPEDNAWYAVSLNYGRPRRRAAYFDIHYERVRPAGEVQHVDVRNMNQVRDAVRRFRRASVQLQDPQCHQVKVKKLICASYERPEDLKFYDAKVTKVRFFHIKVFNVYIDINRIMRT